MPTYPPVDWRLFSYPHQNSPIWRDSLTQHHAHYCCLDISDIDDSSNGWDVNYTQRNEVVCVSRKNQRCITVEAEPITVLELLVSPTGAFWTMLASTNDAFIFNYEQMYLILWLKYVDRCTLRHFVTRKIVGRIPYRGRDYSHVHEFLILLPHQSFKCQTYLIYSCCHGILLVIRDLANKSIFRMLL